MNKDKVFYTAFHKCATTSLAYFFHDLGYRVCDHGVFQPSAPKNFKGICSGDYSRMIAAAEENDAFTDSPWFLFYELFDNLYDNAKFIHAIRDPESWYKSCLKYFKDSPAAPIDKFIYGNDVAASVENNKTLWIERYLRHNQEVLDYFKGRDNFLLIDFFNKEGVEDEICNFLGINRGNASIPRANQTKPLSPTPSLKGVQGRVQNKQKRFAICQLGDKKYMSKWTECISTVSDYCKKYQYDHILLEESIDSCDPTYQKPKFLLRHIDKYDYVMWLDADVVIANDAVRLESFVDGYPDKDLIACEDPGGWSLNAGALIFRNSPSTIDLLETWWSYRDTGFHGEDWRTKREGIGLAHDQSTLIALLGADEWLGRCDPEVYEKRISRDRYHIYSLKENKFNTHPKLYSPGDFLIHFMGYSSDRVVPHISIWHDDYKQRFEPKINWLFLSYLCSKLTPDGYGDHNHLDPSEALSSALKPLGIDFETSLRKKLKDNKKLEDQWWATGREKIIDNFCSSIRPGNRALFSLISEDVSPSSYLVEKESMDIVRINGSSDLAILTMHDEKTRKHGVESENNILSYANEHGFAAYSSRSNPFPAIHSCWAKWKIMEKFLDSHEYLVWMDADTLIVDSEWSIKSIIETHEDFDILPANDLDTSVFVVKCTDKGKDVVRKMCSYIDEASPDDLSLNSHIHSLNDDHRQAFREKKADRIFSITLGDSDANVKPYGSIYLGNIDRVMCSQAHSYSKAWAIHFSHFFDEEKFVLMKNFNKIISED